MNLSRIRSIGDCETRLQWCRVELASKIRNDESGQKWLRAEISILTRLIDFLKAPKLFEPKLQMIPVNKQPNDNMKNTANHYRQGDVLIVRVVSIPNTAVRQKRCRRIILAHGEVTGHHHALQTMDPADWWKAGEGINAETFINVGAKGAVITHEEHAPIELTPGNYRVTRQREYSPKEIRNVQD